MQGLRDNILQTFSDLENRGAEDIAGCPSYKRWLFSLALFHSIISERRKFGPLGWNKAYEWTVFDFRVRQSKSIHHIFSSPSSKCILLQIVRTDTPLLNSPKPYLLRANSDNMLRQVSQQSLFEAASADEEMMSWDRIVFLTADIHYGGRVTDQMDQRLLTSLLKRCFAATELESQVADPVLRGYVLPSDYCYEDIMEFAMCLPVDTAPEILGLDSGAAVVYVSNDVKQCG